MRISNNFEQNGPNFEDGKLGNKPKKNRVRKYIKEFCQSTTIQGPAYIVKNISFWERLWWITIFILGVIGSCIMVYQIWDKYVSTPVLVSLATKEEMIRDIPFPAVTICPQAKVANKCLNYTNILMARKAGRMEETDPRENIIFDYMSLLCKSDNHEGTISILLKSLNETTRKMLELAGAPISHKKGFSLHDYLRFLTYCSTVNLSEAHCEWMGGKIKCKDVLTPILTEKGLCFSFNMYDVRDIYSDLNTMNYAREGVRRKDWSPDRGYFRKTENLEELYPRKAFLSGAKNAFVAVFFTHKDDIDYACEDFSIQGMQVTLHTPTRIPRPERVSFSVGLDSIANAAVIPSYTQTSDRIKHYDPKKRFCYFENERQLKYFKFYSQSNCNFECYINYTITQCDCVNFYMPRDNETRVCRLSERFCLQDARKSYNEDILKERLDRFRSDDKTMCKCLPLCADLSYNAELSQSEWDWSNTDEVEFDSFNRSELSM
ncbi:pickpocket protein 28-like isoform X2 [Coccinella septempunctata]|nr:pickpocket protein 28-like isoform X2 [Coccinella septempunctata]